MRSDHSGYQLAFQSIKRAAASSARHAAVALATTYGVGCSAAPEGPEDGRGAVLASAAEALHGETSEGDRSTHSTPIALSSRDSLLWAVNVDGNSVAVIRTDTQALVGSLRVGDSPQSVAIDPANSFAYVANAKSNDVSVIDVREVTREGFANELRDRRIVTGGAPSSVVVSPDGQRVFVANGSQDTVTVLNGRHQAIIAVIDLRKSACNVDDPSRHFHPRAMTVTADSKHLYVTRFLSYTRPGGVQADDHGKEGVVCRIDLAPGAHWSEPGFTPIRLAATDSGFPDPHGDPTAAFPNQLESIVLRDGHAYLPNVAASPSGPLHFDVDTQAYVNRIDGIGAAETDSGALNLHLGARVPDAGKLQLFFANPRAMEFTTARGSGTAYVVSSGSDLLVKLNVDDAGVLHFTGGDSTTRYIDLNDPGEAI